MRDGGEVATGRVAGESTAGPAMARVAVACVALGVLSQICYPLLSGTMLDAATVASVLLLVAAAVAHASAVSGFRAAAAVLVAAAGVGLLAEAVGTRTGYPFGSYAYASDQRLGPHLLGVPVVVPLAWAMLAYPALLLARRLSRHRGTRVLLGAGTLTGWDLFLDPQMVAAGHWTWQSPAPALPGVPDVPLTNFAGWLLVGLVLVAVLDQVLPEPGPPSMSGSSPGSTPGTAGASNTLVAVPAAVLTWTWLGSTLGNLAFFDRPWVALYGFAGMGLFVAPYLRDLFVHSHFSRATSRPGVAG